MRDFSLQREDTFKFTLVVLRPQVPIRHSVDQLRSDTHVPSDHKHRALNNGIHAELSGDFRYG